jgi:hypothetical protein
VGGVRYYPGDGSSNRSFIARSQHSYVDTEAGRGNLGPPLRCVNIQSIPDASSPSGPTPRRTQNQESIPRFSRQRTSSARQTQPRWHGEEITRSKDQDKLTGTTRHAKGQDEEEDRRAAEANSIRVHSRGAY